MGRLVMGVIVVTVLAACGAAQPAATDTGVLTPMNTTTTGIPVARTLPTEPLTDRYCAWPTTTTRPPNQIIPPSGGIPYRPICVTPPTTPLPPPTTLPQAAVMLTRSDNGRRFAVRVGTVVTVQLTPDTTSEDGSVQSANRLVLQVVSSTTGVRGQSQTVFRAVAPGHTDLLGPKVIQHCPPVTAPPYPVCEGTRPIDWSAGISVFS